MVVFHPCYSSVGPDGAAGGTAYGPAGDWEIVIVSPGSGSLDPLSIEADALQFAPAETVTFLQIAAGAWFM